MARPKGIPQLSHHKRSGLAVVRLDGRDHYCGRWNADGDQPSAEAAAAYHRLIAEWIAAGPGAAERARDGDGDGRCETVAEVCDAYLSEAVRRYRKNGRETSEVERVRAVMGVVLGLYAAEPVERFGPLALKACRQVLVTAGHARSSVNIDVGRVKRMFAWAGENELIDPMVHHRLRCVRGLAAGEGGAETAERQPVAWEHVDAVRDLVARQVWAMIRLQWHTGMRPGSACIMRTGDVDRTGAVWVYTPHDHKMATRGKRLHVALGPQAQAVTAEWLRADPDAYLFQPHEAVAEQRAERRRQRQTKLWPSHAMRPHVRRPRRKPGSCYRVDSYRRAITRACQAAGIETWTPHQLRHSFATRVRATFTGDLDAVAAALGHAGLDTAEVYAHLKREKAAEVAARIG